MIFSSYFKKLILYVNNNCSKEVAKSMRAFKLRQINAKAIARLREAGSQ